jgi:hypothetical protein
MLPVLGLLLVILAVVSGGYLVAGALSEPAGPPVDVADSVRVSPLSGWELAGRFTDPPRARLTRGSGNLDVAALPFDRADRDLLRLYVENALDANAEQLSVSDVEVARLESGLVGARISYVGVFNGVQGSIEGQVTAFVSPSGTGVVFDGWAPSGLLEYVLDDIETMIARAVVA